MGNINVVIMFLLCINKERLEFRFEVFFWEIFFLKCFFKSSCRVVIKESENPCVKNHSYQGLFSHSDSFCFYFRKILRQKKQVYRRRK